MGYVTNETYNKAAKQFTTNFFRCYDLPLAMGRDTSCWWLPTLFAASG